MTTTPMVCAMRQSSLEVSVVRVAVIGIGKMGLSHLSMVRAHPEVEVVGVCDSVGYVLDVLAKYTGLRTFTDVTTMLDAVQPDAVLIATPTTSHVGLVREVLARGTHVFCEKPLSLSAVESRELSELAEAQNVVTQVGYHNRFVGAFQEVKRLVDAQVIGPVSHVLAESYGPVVLRSKGSTWRSKRTTGGGCLYDYAAHPLDLLNWYFGEPVSAGGTVLGGIFSTETDDEVYSTLRYSDNVSAQLSVNWSDETHRKMTTKVTIWGQHGKIVADRQECQVYLRDTATVLQGYRHGWNVRYTTELTQPVWFYLRGEEYSAQLDYFITSILSTDGAAVAARQNDFASAAATDRVIEMLLHSAAAGDVTNNEAALSLSTAPESATSPTVSPTKSLFRRRVGSSTKP
jgi:scyllo-inositol 2-dehydrogenase (NADP+)